MVGLGNPPLFSSTKAQGSCSDQNVSIVCSLRLFTYPSFFQEPMSQSNSTKNFVRVQKKNPVIILKHLNLQNNRIFSTIKKYLKFDEFRFKINEHLAKFYGSKAR